VCDSLGIKPVPNNGTLRLPFKPIGLHSDPGAPVVDTPQDFPEQGVGHASTTSASSPSTSTDAPLPNEGLDLDHGGDDDDDIMEGQSLWEWLRQSLEEIKSRIKGLFGGK
jgi:hypothetical protein